MDYKKLSRVVDSTEKKPFRYKVYYPGKSADKYDVEEFEADTDEKAKAAAEDFAANFKREEVIINKVTDSEEAPEGWTEVVAGINEIPCGIINSEHKKFRPYIGKWMDGYEFEETYGDWPFEDSEEARGGLKEIAEQWGVPVESIETGANDSFEGGYLYVRGKDLGEEIDITEEDVDEDSGSIFLSDDFVETLFRKESPENSWFWLPPSIDQ